MAFLQGITIYMQGFFGNLRIAIREDSKGWTICLCVLILTILRSGITYSFGEFVVELEATYHRPLAEQSEYNCFVPILNLKFLLKTKKSSIQTHNLLILSQKS